MTVGNFDGVHKGHVSVIDQLGEIADELGAATAVVTFEPHTLETIRPGIAPQRLTSAGRKVELLAGHELDFATVLTFDKDRAAQPAEDFVEEILVGCLHARVVMVGEDFRFGKAAAGDVELLRRLGQEFGFRVEPIRIVAGPDGPYSSTTIRAQLAQGRLGAVADALGRDYDLRAQVIRGDERGRELGFPTANVDPGDKLATPPLGVYAGRVRRIGADAAAGTEPGTAHTMVMGDWMPAVINFGVRPTFRSTSGKDDTGNDARPLIEAHVFDFDDDIYGDTVDVSFADFLRPEQRFDSIDALKSQIATDAQAARAVLGDV